MLGSIRLKHVLLIIAVMTLMAASPVSARPWVSSGGQFAIETELVETKDGNVRLKRQDGGRG